MSAKQNRKKRRKPTNWDAKLDKLWSLLVKHRAGWRCEYCGSREKVLNSHHIYSRSNRSTRWDLENGVCLCGKHHTIIQTAGRKRRELMSRLLIGDRMYDLLEEELRECGN